MTLLSLLCPSVKTRQEPKTLGLSRVATSSIISLVPFFEVELILTTTKLKLFEKKFVSLGKKVGWDLERVVIGIKLIWLNTYGTSSNLRVVPYGLGGLKEIDQEITTYGRSNLLVIARGGGGNFLS